MYLINKENINNQEFTIIEVSQKDIKVSFINYGATILNIYVPDKDRLQEAVLIEYAELSSYLKNSLYLNSTIGPSSGRIGDAAFSIDNILYNLDKNFMGKVNLHGGSETFAFKFFDYEITEGEDFTKVIFTLDKRQKESRFPGNQEIKIIYTITKDNLLIEFKAKTDEDTLLNLTNHAYFNLSGNLKSNILNHELYLNSSNIIQLDEYSVPYEVKNILNSELDYKQLRQVQGEGFKGLDNPYLLDEINFNLPCVKLVDPISKRKLEVYTDYECVVCYTHEYPNNSKLLFNIKQEKNMGICFEAQHSPNGINIIGLEDSILRKGKTYNQKTLFNFSIDQE